MDQLIAMLKCKHALDTKRNDEKEELCFCQQTDRWMNITLAECIGNCEEQCSENRGFFSGGGIDDKLRYD